VSLFVLRPVADMRTYQNEHNMLLNCPQCLSILLLQTDKTDNNALDIDAVYNLKLRKTQPNSTDSVTTKLNATFPWPPIMMTDDKTT
jgi:hypothetical protein